MYLKHFGLTQLPFNLTPDTQFFCDLPTHREALNVLLIALQGGEGFIKITGPVGTGKTLLCRKLLNELPAPFVTAYIPNPDMDTTALHQSIADEFNLRYARSNDQSRILVKINKYLLQASQQGQKVVLIIDEAQAMPLKTLESLRLLTNLETEKQKLLQIVLFAQPELDKILQQKSIRQLRQRISFSYQLQALNKQQIQEYLLHRLYIAGNTHTDLLGIFSATALQFYTKGIPRLINILAHKALLAAYGKGHSSIGWQHIHLAAVDTEDTRRHLNIWLFRKVLPWLVVASAVFIYFLPRLPL
ncbi:AAA family ATPase [Methylomonas sp. AM2-LC]|uniref:ExeA family protein n=1 Tax=Methylomonas sp. AM2-LC TaxID=3153301 RepID=UPI0032675A8B